ncbi:Putative esterase OS=uncultured microorganism PE=4 SV=1: Abhydrolase_6 [Gemmataceae bacterium]|nr:Putative esterase OS=uncultured microorganism PE=4 SV=1: Abhydrolase_6 [Gemmataceae bacterium]VTU00053.1 Putative esterase OS=uncultured microorganism PE=4 SV=1: Abhydrolase_6 [Gemmataceae bacterium]
MIETESLIPQLAAPIVLAPGLGGYNRVSACGQTLRNYFPGVPELLEAAGNRVIVARVSPTDGVARRAADLKRFIGAAVPTGPFHLIGHSMGGLDSRYMTAKLGMEGRVLSVTTVGTPHRGSTFADWGVGRFARLVLPLLKWLGIPHQAFFDLTTDACRRFNEEVLDVPGVRYYSVAGDCERSLLGPEWFLPYSVVTKAEGANDGVVSVASAAWGEHSEVWSGDHLNLVNWPNRYARRRGGWPGIAPDYGRIVRRLAQAGF